MATFKTESIYEYEQKLKSLLFNKVNILDKGVTNKIIEEVNPIPFTKNYIKNVTEYYIIW